MHPAPVAPDVLVTVDAAVEPVAAFVARHGREPSAAEAAVLAVLAVLWIKAA